jgi:DHA1 family bicyclomycin/chloramphenicol resistance-like MFS transporter
MPQAKGRINPILQGSRLVFSALYLQIAGHFYEGSFRNIGIIIAVFILLTVITLFFVITNRELMQFSPEQ